MYYTVSAQRIIYNLKKNTKMLGNGGRRKVLLGTN